MPNGVPAALRSAWRAARRAPGFAAAVALTLALGIGLAASMATVARAVAFARLPVRAQERLVVLWGEQPSLAHVPVSLGALDSLAAGGGAVAAAAGVDFNGAWPVDFRLGDAPAPPTRLPQGVVAGAFFDVLGARALLGRALRPSDDVRGGPVVAVLGHAAWRRHFGADPGVVGRTFRSVQGARLYTVVGVMPPGLDYPRGAALWVPLRTVWDDPTYAAVDVVARLAPWATPAQAAAAFTARARRPGALTRGTARPLADAVVGDARRAFTLTSAAAALVLAVACLNVAGLLLVRAERRRGELAVRAAVGAGRGRLARDLLAEHAGLAAAGGVLGAGLAALLVRAFARLAPADLPRVAEVRVDGGLVAAAVVATAAVVLAVGLAPAVGVARRTAAADVLHGAGRGTVGGRRAARGRRALVGAQVTLAVVVLAAAGLLGRSFARLRAADLGLPADRLALVELVAPAVAAGPNADTTAARWNATLDQIVARVGALPGVAGVAPAGATPFPGSGGWLMRPTPEGAAPDDTARSPWLRMEATTAAFARAAGVPLLRGRFLADADREGAPGAVVLSEHAARAMFPGQDAVGRRVRLGREDPFGWRTVVGVVGETRWHDLRRPTPAIYIPYRQFGASPTFLVVRTAGEPGPVLPAVRRGVQEAAPTVVVTAARPFRALAAAPLARPRLLSALLAAFALAAVALTAVGLFGVVATSVAERGRELGIRSALGARPAALRALVVGEGLRVAAAGAALGTAAALAGGRLVGGLLYDVRPADPLALGGSAAALLAVAAAACLAPARRAARTDPAVALRAE